MINLQTKFQVLVFTVSTPCPKKLKIGLVTLPMPCSNFGSVCDLQALLFATISLYVLNWNIRIICSKHRKDEPIFTNGVMWGWLCSFKLINNVECLVFIGSARFGSSSIEFNLFCVSFPVLFDSHLYSLYNSLQWWFDRAAFIHGQRSTIHAWVSGDTVHKTLTKHGYGATHVSDAIYSMARCLSHRLSVCLSVCHTD